MPRLFSVLALAAAFLPAAFANQTDCNVASIVLKAANGRDVLATTNTDFEQTSYDAPITGATETVYLQVNQNPSATAQFNVKVNNELINSTPGGVGQNIFSASGFDTQCGHNNVVLVEVEEVKNAKQRFDSCHFKYQINYINPACGSQ